MQRTLTRTLAVVAALAFSTAVKADDTDTTPSASDRQQVELASYGRDYANSYTNAQTPQAMAFGGAWGGAASNRDCSRFYHYPYVFYPQNFRGSEYYRSSDSMYYRYPPEMQIPVYNKAWHNYYPSSRRYHWGHHFITDVF